ncbi:MAG: hypothetical protein LBI04_01630 [Treponema sp.]|jgi:hypothetical protein|nr:hypothetical protein [Treponema sp.]
MFTKEFFEVLKHIITSWQVIAVSIALVLYLKIVSYAARSYHRPREKRIRIRRKKAELAPASIPEEAESGSNTNDELGLEEA